MAAYLGLRQPAGSPKTAHLLVEIRGRNEPPAGVPLLGWLFGIPGTPGWVPSATSELLSALIRLRVMYYTEAADVTLWKEVKPKATVEYTGVISNAKEATGIVKKPFVYVDLHHVKVVKWQSANIPVDDER